MNIIDLKEKEVFKKKRSEDLPISWMNITSR